MLNFVTGAFFLTVQPSRHFLQRGGARMVQPSNSKALPTTFVVNFHSSFVTAIPFFLLEECLGDKAPKNVPSYHVLDTLTSVTLPQWLTCSFFLLLISMALMPKDHTLYFFYHRTFAEAFQYFSGGRPHFSSRTNIWELVVS